MATTFHVGNRDFISEDEAIEFALSQEVSKVTYTEFDEAGQATAQGGICVDDDCHCSKYWTYWSDN